LNEEPSLLTREWMDRALEQDDLWNFRDVALSIPGMLKEGCLYRGPTLSRLENQRGYTDLLRRFGIQRIIDLRFPEEVARLPYSTITKSLVDVVNVPLIHQPVEHRILGPEIGQLHVDFIDNASTFKKIYAYLAEGIPTYVHCHYGKDRTGVVIALVLLSLDIPRAAVMNDFLTPPNGFNETDAETLFAHIARVGGVHAILNRFGIPQGDMDSVRRWLTG